LKRQAIIREHGVPKQFTSENNARLILFRCLFWCVTSCADLKSLIAVLWNFVFDWGSIVFLFRFLFISVQTKEEETPLRHMTIPLNESELGLFPRPPTETPELTHWNEDPGIVCSTGKITPQNLHAPPPPPPQWKSQLFRKGTHPNTFRPGAQSLHSFLVVQPQGQTPLMTKLASGHNSELRFQVTAF
jgi:hypothetical protein